MKRTRFLTGIAAALAAGALWLVLREGDPDSTPAPEGRFQSTPAEAREAMQETGGRGAGRMLAPPDPNRRFTDFTPEQRVEFARRGHGPGG